MSIEAADHTGQLQSAEIGRKALENELEHVTRESGDLRAKLVSSCSCSSQLCDSVEKLASEFDSTERSLDSVESTLSVPSPPDIAPGIREALFRGLAAERDKVLLLNNELQKEIPEKNTLWYVTLCMVAILILTLNGYF